MVISRGRQGTRDGMDMFRGETQLAGFVQREFGAYPMMNVMYKHLPSVDRMTDRHLWKHCLPATSLSGGNYDIITLCVYDNCE